MKKLAFLFSCLLLVASTSFGQGAKGNKEQKSPEEKAAALSKQMAKKFTLTADQSGKIQAINVKHAQASEALRAKFATDRKSMMPEMKALNTSYENELKAVFTAEQFAAFQAEKEEKMKARQEKMAAKKKSL